MRRGEIWWVRLPPSTGHEQAGERPAIIVQDKSFVATLPTVLVIPLQVS
jgi:mRNA interferase MazF